ncbi:non-ribosomal peptide synthetase [Pyxidicoccus sp. MSG2]|uniref:non-ribosomal peptide synthetase n=1 Tax=Pyxidicoccus sp. MSG2 TaxID=2996790 RepID=UPI0022721956|nr:non-ribosomal peptide synthetase [Pyxidicoccus sp. MSG2]MCY1022339.1 amino acid adenylation domain-containing protein [Pyxidicoccus sp. MSG2]
MTQTQSSSDEGTRQRGDAPGRRPPLTHQPHGGEAVQSFAQQRLWFLAQLDPGGFAYNAPFATRLTGPLDVGALEAGFQEVVQRHESLRTTFAQVEGHPVQRIHAKVELTLEVEDVAEAEVVAHAEQEARRPFDLERGPLLRVRLLRVSPDEHVLLWTVHHIVFDGWSMGVLEREVAAAYGARVRGAASELEPLPAQYADYARWQREWLKGEVLERQLAWWKEQLAGVPPVLELPTDRPRPPVQSFRGALLRVPLPEELTSALRELSRKEGATLFMTLLAGFHALLARYSGQSDVVVGSPFAGRSQHDLEGMVGFFANTLALRADTEGVSFPELLGRVRKACLGAFVHQDLPFEQLVDALQSTRDLSRAPIFQAAFALQGEPGSELKLSGMSATDVAFEPGVSKFDLTLFVRETPQGLMGLWEYSTALFDEATIARMAARYVRLLESAVARPEQRVSELPLLSEAERHQLLVEWNDTQTEYPCDACIHGLFEAQAARTPDAVAVEFEGARLTYAELNGRANQLARYLRRRGVVAGTRVGLCAGRSLELVVATLAILKAGGAYVPLDSAYPGERLAFMVEDSNLHVLLAQPALFTRLPPDLRVDVVPLVPMGEAFSQGRSENPGRPLDSTRDNLTRKLAEDAGRLQASMAQDISCERTEDLGEPGAADRLAYVMYTSGSTGRPKAVGIPHRGVVRLVKGTRFVELSQREVLLQLAPISFDASTFELWGALLNGAKLVLFPEHSPSLEELGRALVCHRVTTLWLTAALFEQVMAAQPEALSGVRQVLAGGDVLSPTAVRARLAQGGLLINGYGPTENTTFTCCNPMTQPGQVGPTVSIGRPISNTQVYLLDAALEPVPVGVWGELYTGGDGLAWGYLGRAELTAERFVPHPFSARPGARLYRTGDRARWLPDGRIEFSGRLDGQVKLRGFRIEPGEVESALLRHPGVREAVVVAREDGPGGKRLVAYFVPHGEAPATAELRAHAQAKLPEYMVPSAFVALPALPLTPNGKVDRKALPAPYVEAPSGEQVAPRTAMEQVVAGVFGPLLGLEQVGADSHFFELGGHSLLATQAVSRLREVVGRELPVRALFEAPTVAQLARRLEEADGATSAPLTHQPHGGEAVQSFAQQRLWFLSQFDASGISYNIPFALRLKGPLDVEALEAGFQEVARRHESLRTTFAEVDGRPIQRIHARLELNLRVAEVAEAEVVARAEQEARQPFDLEQGPLLRVRLLRVAPEEHVLLWTVHHIVFDGWSVGVLYQELSESYSARVRGEVSRLDTLPVQYADYARWQREWLKGEVLERQLAWWKEHLAGAPPVLELPTDRPRPPVQSFRGALLRVPLPDALASALRRLSQREGATLYMTLLAGFQALLARYSGQSDLVVGSPISGRNWREVEPLLGFFVNTLALRVDTGGGVSFRELLGRVRKACLGAFAHQDLPFEHLVDALQPTRDLSRSPLFQVMFVMPGTPRPLALEDVTAEELVFEPGVAKFDLTLFAWEQPRGLETYWEYNTDLYDEATVARMVGHYVWLLQAAVAEPGQRVDSLPLLGEAERDRLLLEWGSREDSTYVPGLMHRWVEAQVARTPGAEAVTDGTRSLTYAELDARANQLAHHLLSLGVRPNGSVGLCLDRGSLDMPVAVLATLKAGAAFLPLDPTWPSERLALMLEDTGAPVVVAHGHLVSAVPAGSGAHLLRLDEAAEAVSACPTHVPPVEVSPETHCYFVYTSGSTGRPKGIVMSHRAVGNMLWWLLQRSVKPDATTLQFASLNFDVSFQEMFGTWCLGGRVLLMTPPLRQDPTAMLRYMVRHRVERLYLPFVALQALCDAALGETELPPLTEVVTAGEQLQVTPALVAFFERLPGCVLENQYGPSEAHVVTAWRASGPPSSWPALPPVGRPIPNVRLQVVDSWGAPCPIGVPGEVYVAGASLAHGYHGRPDLTADRFVPDMLGGASGARTYRTGDRARWLADGNLEFLGRLDGQVKLRGFRIELGEVEVVLRAFPGVRDAVAIVREDVPGDRRLVAYVVPQEGPSVELAGLREHLQAKLPEYMVPSAFVPLATLPLAPTGKVDRKALPAPKADASQAGLVAPRTAMEQVVAGVFGPLLGLERVGTDGHFFELGGHSLLATQAVSRLRDVVGRELPVRALFEAPTVAQLARRLEEVLEEERGVPPPPLVHQPHGGEAVQSFAQQRLWFVSQIDVGGFSYNMPNALRLKGPLDVGALEAGFQEVVRRHESLRTTFAEVEGQPIQRIHPEVELRLEVEEVAEADVIARAEQEARTPFDLERGPLLRVRLLRVTPEEHVLLWTVHHIVFDGWSMGVLEREVAALYGARVRGEALTLEALPVQYADYARWQREWLKGEVLERQLSWWKEQLAGVPPVLELPTDRPRPTVQSFNGAHLSMRLPPELAGALRELSRKEGVTLFMTLLAGFQALLARYSGQSDLVVGSPISGRNWREVEPLLGFFVNTLALRVDTGGGASFRELLGRVRKMCLGAYAHQDLPFEHVVDALQPARDLSRSPLFQVMFVMPGATVPMALPGLASEEVAFEPGMAKFDLTLFVRELPQGLVAFWEYNTDLHDAETVARMAGHYVRLLQGAASRPGQRVDSLPLLGEAERRRLLVEWNATEAPRPTEPNVHALFEVWAERTPDAIAVRMGDARLTYGELNRKANRLAHLLRGAGVGPEVLVGLCVGRSLDLAVGVLGILKAGGAYVPLDPAYPPERLAMMLRASRAPLLLTQSTLPAVLPPDEVRRLCLDTETFAGASEVDLPALAGPESLAYVIYTSGSTGVPKGVAMPHGPLLNLLHWQTGAFVVPRGRTLQFSALSFDVSFQELLSTWAVGGELVLISEAQRLDARALLELMDRQEVERLFLPFVALQNLAEVADREECVPRRLREIITAGEQLRVTPALRRFIRRLGDCVLHNQYGPTECHATTALLLSGDTGTWPDLPSIGQPISNGHVHLLDEHLAPVPIGVSGELYIGGELLARGYLHRPELTPERFIPDPFSSRPGARLYRTGDFARYLPDGALEFLGRRDAQVKVRGYRIELAEVESALAHHPALKDCVVEAREDGSGHKRLVGYVVGAGGPPPPAAELRAFLKERLPDYMVPGHFVPMDAFPLSPSGKVNRRALPAPEGSLHDSTRVRVAPRSALELQLVRAWEEVLGLHPVGIRDDFFELGGHSLLAVRLLGRIRELTGRALPVAALFQGATVEHVAGLLRREQGPSSSLVQLRGGTAKRPFFCIHPVGGTVLAYAELAHLLGPDQPFYGVQSPGLEGEAPPVGSLEDLAARYLEAVRAVQSRGPYLLGGWSMGGSLAFEMARQLASQGEEVGLLALIDTYAQTFPGGTVTPEWLEPARLGALFYRDLLRATGADLPCPEEELSRLAPDEALRVLEEAGRKAAALPESGMQSLHTLRRVFESNLRAAWSYVPRPYAGALLSFEASEATRPHGWEPLARGGVEVHTLEGDHYSLLRGPGVRTLAALLRDALARAHAGDARSPRSESA